MSIRVGTSGYNYPEWRGTFYPERLPAAKMLSYYAERLATVEINYTFYRMPSARPCRLDAGRRRLLLRPQGAEAHHHDARLRGRRALRYFLDVVRGLGAKLGPLLFQLPPNFKKDAGRLGDLLALLPPDLRCAFEFRHASWFADDVYDLLRARHAALCVADTEAGTTPLVATADLGYFRLRDQGYPPRSGHLEPRSRGAPNGATPSSLHTRSPAAALSWRRAPGPYRT
jgi:uncharacterized protein YecE (DUF72 family)